MAEQELCKKAFTCALELWTTRTMMTEVKEPVSLKQRTRNRPQPLESCTMLDIELCLTHGEPKGGGRGVISFFFRTLLLCFRASYKKMTFVEPEAPILIMKTLMTNWRPCAFDKQLLRKLSSEQRHAMAWCFHDWFREDTWLIEFGFYFLQESISATQPHKHREMQHIFLEDYKFLLAVAQGVRVLERSDSIYNVSVYRAAGEKLKSMIRLRIAKARRLVGQKHLRTIEVSYVDRWRSLSRSKD